MKVKVGSKELEYPLGDLMYFGRKQTETAEEFNQRMRAAVQKARQFVTEGGMEALAAMHFRDIT